MNEKQLKFENGGSETVIIKSAGMEQVGNFEKHIVRIETTIDGFDHFLPAKGLRFLFFTLTDPLRTGTTAVMLFTADAPESQSSY